MGIDYHREKYGTIALANHLRTQGWEEVRLSVRPRSLDSTLDGAAVPDIDPVRDATDPESKHSIYYIHPGRVDLVARRGQELLLVEAKGKSAPPGKGVKDVIRQIVKHIDLDREDRAYGILVPDDSAWLAALSRDRSLTLKIVTVFLVSREGAVRTWPPRPADEEGTQAAAEKEIPAADDADDHDPPRVQRRITRVLGALGAVLRTPVHRLASHLPARLVRATAPRVDERTPASGTSEVTAGPPGPPSQPAPSPAEPVSARVEEVDAVISTAPERPSHPSEEVDAVISTAPERPSHPSEEVDAVIAAAPERPSHPSEEVDAVISTAPERPSHPSEEVDAVISTAPERPSHPFDSVQDAATELRRVAVSEGAGPLHPLPFNRYDPVDTDWWLSPVTENPAFKFGKIVLTSEGAAPDDLFIGLGFEKGIGPTAAELFAPDARGRRRLMDPTWAWQRVLMPALRSGAFTDAAVAAEAAAGVPLTVFMAAIYVPPSPGWDDATDVRSKDLPRDVIRFECSGGTLALIDVELAAGLLDGMTKVDTFPGVASVLGSMPKGDWAWNDFTIGIRLGRSTPPGEAGWSARDIWRKACQPWSGWVG